MKKLLITLTTVVTLGICQRTDAQVYGNISFNTFYNELSPYGRWVNDINYGQVWIADAPGFEPYYDNGHWIYTSYGWTWVSDYPWGWAPFHYGRWTYLPTWGWAWVPGYEWGPAWVGWCQNDGYYGWAPLSPGIGFSFSYNSIPYNYWRFVRQQYITGPQLRNHIIRPERNRTEFRNVTVINNTQVTNNVTYVAGPKREAVERITRQKITARPVAFTGTDERTRVDNQQVRMYRPDLKPATSTTATQPVKPTREELQANQQPKNVGNNAAAGQPLPATTAPANAVKPGVKQPVQPITQENDRKVRPLPDATEKDASARADQPVVSPRQPNERVDRKEIEQRNEQLQQNAQRQNEVRQQRVQEQQLKEQQIKAQQEQQRQEQLQEQKLQQQEAVQMQNEQRQNELRQQQLRDQKEQQLQLQQQRQNELRQQQQQEQRAQQQLMRQQQQQQRQNEIRQQRMQEAPARPQRQVPMNQKPPSRKPHEN